ncbi:GyrI-like domain-containing protein [Streptomyces galbus]|nr:GyrI-like domain-containing protein [Streptomyces galbus]
MAELDAVVGAPAGPSGGPYGNALFSEGRGDVLGYVPVAAPVPDLGRVRGTERPPAELAVTVHPGAHDTIDVTYGELGRWVADHALAVAGPVRETYLVGPRDTPAADRWQPRSAGRCSGSPTRGPARGEPAPGDGVRGVPYATAACRSDDGQR